MHFSWWIHNINKDFLGSFSNDVAQILGKISDHFLSVVILVGPYGTTGDTWYTGPFPIDRTQKFCLYCSQQFRGPHVSLWGHL